MKNPFSPNWAGRVFFFDEIVDQIDHIIVNDIPLQSLKKVLKSICHKVLCLNFRFDK